MLRKSLPLLALAVLACGKRGDPHPPVPVVPKATGDLVVAQRGAGVILSWSYPSETTAGEKLTAVRRIVVYRAIEDVEGAPPPIGKQRFARIAQRLDSLEAAKLTGATVGARLIYEDAPPFQSAAGKPLRADYAVVTEGNRARSELSNIVSIVPVDVAVPPGSLEATAKPEGVVLTWSAPEKTINGKEKPHIIGFDVYRMARGQAADELARPLNATPAAGTTYTDVPPYGEQEYWVTAVAATLPSRIESDASAHVTVDFKDLLPPPVPTGLTALVETNAVRLVWDPVDAPDLAGYKIYRTEGAGTGELKIVGRLLLTKDPITQTNFRDISMEHGISYFYEVTSIDKSGNESKPAKTGWVLLPRTP